MPSDGADPPTIPTAEPAIAGGPACLASGAPAFDAAGTSSPRRRHILALKITVATGLFAFLLGSGRLDPSTLATVSSVPALLLALGAVLGNFALSTLRWRGLLRSLGIPVAHKECFRIAWLGLLGSQVLPGVTGGDLVRGASIARSVPTRRTAAILSVVIDRGIGLIGLLWIGTIALFLAPAELRNDPLLATVTRSVALLCALGTIGLAVVSSPRLWRSRTVSRLEERLSPTGAPRKLLTALALLGGQRRAVATALLISLLAHGCTIAAATRIATGNLGATIGLLDHALLVPVGQLAAALPISPGGVGVSEWVYEGMFARLGAHHGAELSLWLRLLTITASLGALPWLVAHRAPRPTAQTPTVRRTASPVR